MPRLLTALLLTLLVTAGCGGGDDGDNGPSGPTDPGDPTPLTAMQIDLLPWVFGAGYITEQAIDAAMTTAAEAVDTASEITGVATFTGTLQQNGDGSYQYLPTPADRLVVQPQGAGPIEIVITAFELSDQVDPEYYAGATIYEFLDVHAAFAFQISGTGASLTIDSTSQPHAGQATTRFARFVAWTHGATGTLTTNDGQTLAIEVTATGTRDFSIDTGVSDATDESGTITGTIVVGGQAINVNETARFIQERDVSSLDGTPQYTVQNLLRSSASSGAVDGATFTFTGVDLRSETRNGAVNQPDYWVGTGTVQRDGRYLGDVRLQTAPVAGGAPPLAVIAPEATGQAGIVIPGGTLGG